jgi:hypothetical protein
MVKDGYALHNESGLDIIADIAGVYWPLRGSTTV